MSVTSHGSLRQKAILITHWYSLPIGTHCLVIAIRVVLITHGTYHQTVNVRQGILTHECVTKDDHHRIVVIQ